LFRGRIKVTSTIALHLPLNISELPLEIRNELNKLLAVTIFKILKMSAVCPKAQ